MENQFQPQTPFEGYVAAKLEDISKKFESLDCKTHDGRIRDCEKTVANLMGKASILGAIAGFMAGVLKSMFMEK